MGYLVRELDRQDREKIKGLFRNVFMREPWNDDWSDERQLDCYMEDLLGNKNSLAFGLFDEDFVLVGMALGCIKHWYEGVEYDIDELCISTELQGKGIGTGFLEKMEEELRERGIHRIFLQTERTVPAYEFYGKRGFVTLEEHVSLVKGF